MSSLTEKTIEELLEYEVFIPADQIGNGRIEKQITDLLNSINAYKPTRIEGSDKKCGIVFYL